MKRQPPFSSNNVVAVTLIAALLTGCASTPTSDTSKSIETDTVGASHANDCARRNANGKDDPKLKKRLGRQTREAAKDIRTHVTRNWVVPRNSRGTVVLFVRLGANGDVQGLRMHESSGNNRLDRSAIAAVNKASPLPVPKDYPCPEVFRELILHLDTK